MLNNKFKILSTRLLRKFFSKHKHSKVFKDAQETILDMRQGNSIVFGGFGLCGIPQKLIEAINQRSDLKELEVISDSAGISDFGLGLLMQDKKIKKIMASFIGDNNIFHSQYLNGELELEFVPQGTLAEKMRNGGAGIPAFYTPTGCGTLVEDGGIPLKYSKDGKTVEKYSQKKEVKEFNGKKYILEKSINPEYACIKAWKGDTKGNLIFRKTARNFNVDSATCAKICIAEVEELVNEGDLDPDHIHLPGIYVHRIFKGKNYEKRIEKRTTSEDLLKAVKEGHDLGIRNRIAKRAAMELRDGMYINLGVGIPTLISNHIEKHLDINIHTENGMLGMGAFPSPENVDPDLIDAGKETVSETPGASYFCSSSSFAMIRGQHLDATFLGGLQVSKQGDLANWIIPGKMVKGMGGAMDLVNSGTRVIITMEHVAKGNNFKILDKCSLPLTGSRVVHKLITDKAVFDFDKEKGMILKEIFKGVTIDEIKSLTGCTFEIARDLKSLNF